MEPSDRTTVWVALGATLIPVGAGGLVTLVVTDQQADDCLWTKPWFLLLVGLSAASVMAGSYLFSALLFGWRLPAPREPKSPSQKFSDQIRREARATRKRRSEQPASTGLAQGVAALIREGEHLRQTELDEVDPRTARYDPLGSALAGAARQAQRAFGPKHVNDWFKRVSVVVDRDFPDYADKIVQRGLLSSSAEEIVKAIDQNLEVLRSIQGQP